MSATSDALVRLQTGFYNSDPQSITNPGGLAAGGHLLNFPAALKDLGLSAGLGQAIVASDAVAAIAAAGGRAGLRRININGGLDFWQRGTSSPASGYLADRWISSPNAGTTFTVARSTDVPSAQFAYSAKMTTAVSGFSLIQLIENPELYRGQTLSFGAWIKGPAGAIVTVGFNDNVNTITSTLVMTGAWQFLSCTGALSAAGTTLYCYVVTDPTRAGDYYTTGLQLEQGTVPTPFARWPLGLELALAYRYFRRIVSTDSNYVLGSGTVFNSTTIFRARIPFLAPMRVTPTIYASSLLAFDGGTAASASVTATYPDQNGVQMDVISSGLTTGRSGAVLLPSGANFDFAAEL